MQNTPAREAVSILCVFVVQKAAKMVFPYLDLFEAKSGAEPDAAVAVAEVNTDVPVIDRRELGH